MIVIYNLRVVLARGLLRAVLYHCSLFTIRGYNAPSYRSTKELHVNGHIIQFSLLCTGLKGPEGNHPKDGQYDYHLIVSASNNGLIDDMNDDELCPVVRRPLSKA